MKLTKNGTFAQISTSLGGNPDRLCLTEDAINTFFTNFAGKLSPGGVHSKTFLLSKNGKEYTMTVIRRGPKGPVKEKISTSDNRSWDHLDDLWIIVPE